MNEKSPTYPKVMGFSFILLQGILSLKGFKIYAKDIYIAGIYSNKLSTSICPNERR